MFRLKIKKRGKNPSDSTCFKRLAATAVVVTAVTIAAVSFADAVYDYSSDEKCPENIIFSTHGQVPP